MNRDRFWLRDAQFTWIEPHLPSDTRGKPRVDDRRVISGIVHVLKSGGRWIDASPDYGPGKTLYNRYVRWAAKGVWIGLFHALAGAGGPPAQVLIDSSAVKAHRSASGGKGGERNQAIGRSRGGRTTKIHALTDRDCRAIAFLLTGGQVADCTTGSALLDAGRPHSPRRQGLRQQRHPSSGRGERYDAEHPAQSQPALEELLLACALSRPQRHRVHVLPPQGLPPRRHAIRPQRRQLPRRRLHRCNRQLLVMSPGPNKRRARCNQLRPSDSFSRSPCSKFTA